MYNNVIDLARELECQVFYNELMSKHTTFRIGGPADLLIKVFNKISLEKILKLIKEYELDYFILGNGSNLLVADDGYRGIVLKLDGDFKNVKQIDKNIIECGAAVPLAKVCVFAMQKGLSGLEFAWGIPGTCGGATYMNVGAYGGDMSGVISECTSMDANGHICRFTVEDLKLSYRRSVFFENKHTIISTTVMLHNEDSKKIREKMYDYIHRRKSKQPLNFPSAGSIFKRPKGNYAGTLIENCGLKGKIVGGAMVSSKHAGFIVNVGNATCKNVDDLINLIQETVFEKTGIFLETEIIRLGNKI